MDGRQEGRLKSIIRSRRCIYFLLPGDGPISYAEFKGVTYVQQLREYSVSVKVLFWFSFLRRKDKFKQKRPQKYFFEAQAQIIILASVIKFKRVFVRSNTYVAGKS